MTIMVTQCMTEDLYTGKISISKDTEGVVLLIILVMVNMKP